MNKSTILVVSSKYPPEYAGSGLRAHRTYKRLNEKYGIEFEVLSSSVTHNMVKKYQYEGVKIYRIAKKVFRIAGFGEEEKNRISISNRIKLKINYFVEGLVTFFYLWNRKNKFSLFHIFGNNNVTSTAITFAKIFKIPLMIEVTMDTESIYQREIFPVNLIARALPERTVIVCISERLKKKCLKMGYVESQIWCRPNPVDEIKYFIEREKRVLYRQKLSKFKSAYILLLNISKFIPRKNQIFLIEVLKLLPEEYKLFLAGPLVKAGPLKVRDEIYFNSIISKIKKYGLEKRVEIKSGFLENANEYIKMSDIFLFPTKKEGLGTPMLESIACGVPVVATKIKGITTVWIKDGINGYTSELKPEEFADKIRRAIVIGEKDLKRSSEEILSLASTTIIDGEYWKKIKSNEE